MQKLNRTLAVHNLQLTHLSIPSRHFDTTIPRLKKHERSRFGNTSTDVLPPLVLDASPATTDSWLEGGVE